MGRGLARLGQNSSWGGGKIGWLSESGSTLETAASSVTDMQFDLRGPRLPKDHGYSLYLALAELLPDLTTDNETAIHHVQGSVTGADEILLNHRTKLVIRTPKTRVSEFVCLTGKTMTVEGHAIIIGKHKLKPITLHTPLYAHCVTTGSTEESKFAADIMRELDTMRIDCRFICGRRQTMRTATGDVSGYSLMLHGMPIEHAIRVQEIGLGSNRKLGCGIFIPHKSIQALT